MKKKIDDAESIEELDLSKDLNGIENLINNTEKGWIKQKVVIQDKGKLKRFSIKS
jgi:hypothetical protein